MSDLDRRNLEMYIYEVLSEIADKMGEYAVRVGITDNQEEITSQILSDLENSVECILEQIDYDIFTVLTEEEEKNDKKEKKGDKDNNKKGNTSKIFSENIEEYYKRYSHYGVNIYSSSERELGEKKDLSSFIRDEKDE
jgi:hypothetical protein